MQNDLETLHAELIDACTPAARLIGCASWFSARVAASLEHRNRDPWTLTLAELHALINATPREPSCAQREAARGEGGQPSTPEIDR